MATVLWAVSSDFVLLNPVTRRIVVWLMNNNAFVRAGIGPTLPAGFELAGVADFDGDSNPGLCALPSAGPSPPRSGIWLKPPWKWSTPGQTIAAGYTLGLPIRSSGREKSYLQGCPRARKSLSSIERY